MTPEEEILLLDRAILDNPSDESAYVERGKLHWKLNHRKEAISDYLKAIRINPDSQAKMLLDYANSILDYYNPDLLNP